MARGPAALIACATALAFVAAAAWARSAAPGDPELVQIGTFNAPTYVTAPPGDGGRIFVVQQGGRIRVIGRNVANDFLNITPLVLSGEERGLLSMAFAPDYATSGRFYVYYTAVSPVGELTIAEFRRSADPNVADPASRRTVLSIPHPTYANHNGGQLQFGPDGYLYIGTGDGGGGGDPFRSGQRLDTLLGKLLRIDPRPGPAGEPYTVPADNPFVGRLGARPEIWAYGLRNPWRFSFDRQTGDLTIADVGQSAWEEINFAPASAGRGRGANFGWSCFEGRHAYTPNSSRPECAAVANHTQPVHEYGRSRGCSITGGYVVRDPALPALQGRYVYGDYCDASVWSAVLGLPDAQDDRQTGVSVAQVTSFGEDACGRVYATSGAGPVYRVRASGSPSPTGCASPSPPRRAACRVPRIVGQTIRVARTRIRRANCRVGRVRYRRSARARGRVLSQSPRPGVRRARGARVSFVVSRGRR